MKAPFGFDAGCRKTGREVLVEWDTDKLVNPHIAIAGMSGSGKSYLIRHLISCMEKTSNSNIRFHMFDPHGDMRIPGASTVLMSEQMPYGLNPLRVSSDPHFGGLRKRIQTFIDTINRGSSTSLGVKQENVLRNLLYDVYEMHGFKRDDPSTWAVDPSTDMLVDGGSANRLYLDIPKSEKDNAKKLAPIIWDPDKFLWWITPDKYVGAITQWLPKTNGRSNPTVDEVLIYARRLLQMSFLGSNQVAVTDLEIFHKAASGYQKKVLEATKRAGGEKIDPYVVEQLDKAGIKAVASFADYVESVRTGVELDHLMKYDSTDVLKSVVDRLENLLNTGLYKNKPLPFDESCRVWHYQLDPLRTSEQKMFVLFRLEELWEQARQRGHSDEVVDVFILDEFGLYATAAQDPDNVINILARESRKYGISLIVAGQDPDAFPVSLIGSIGTKVVLGVDETFWKLLQTKMRVPEPLIKWIKLKSTMAVQFKESGSSKNEWRWVHIK